MNCISMELILEGLVGKVFTRVYDNSVRFNEKIPCCQMDSVGKYILGNGGGWTDSFWVGIFYLAYAYTKDEKFLREADKYQAFFSVRADNHLDVCAEKNYLPLDHDAGFIFSLSQVARYKLTGDEIAKANAVKAAHTLAERFNEKGDFIRAWDTWPWDTDEGFIQEKKGKMIIDSMMNLPLLMWAYEQTGDEKFRKIAISHANTVRKYIVREDYSTYHQFNFNPETGEPLKGVTGQGYYDESCWSRGQAWAIYGFALIYGYTKQEEYLQTAEKLAEYFMNNLDNSVIPLWDFGAKDVIYRPWDSSAGAIAASGMLEISRYSENKRDEMKKNAQSILYSLATHCGAMEIDGCEPLLLHGCIGPAYKKGEEKVLLCEYTDTPTVYGDYFFTEALMKLYNMDFKLFW